MLVTRAEAPRPRARHNHIEYVRIVSETTTDRKFLLSLSYMALHFRFDRPSITGTDPALRGLLRKATAT